VTFATRNMECLFGSCENGEIRLNGYGEIVAEEWDKTGEIRPEISLDAFIIMPNHIHAIIAINNYKTEGAVLRADRQAKERGLGRRRSGSLGLIVGQFKAAVSKRINELRGTPGAAIRHRNYYERIIRDEVDLGRTRKYIRNNPSMWREDKFHK